MACYIADGSDMRHQFHQINSSTLFPNQSSRPLAHISKVKVQVVRNCFSKSKAIWPWMTPLSKIQGFSWQTFVNNIVFCSSFVVMSTATKRIKQIDRNLQRQRQRHRAIFVPKGGFLVCFGVFFGHMRCDATRVAVMNSHNGNTKKQDENTKSWNYWAVDNIPGHWKPARTVAETKKVHVSVNYTQGHRVIQKKEVCVIRYCHAMLGLVTIISHAVSCYGISRKYRLNYTD